MVSISLNAKSLSSLSSSYLIASKKDKLISNYFKIIKMVDKKYKLCSSRMVKLKIYSNFKNNIKEDNLHEIVTFYNSTLGIKFTKSLLQEPSKSGFMSFLQKTLYSEKFVDKYDIIEEIHTSMYLSNIIVNNYKTDYDTTNLQVVNDSIKMMIFFQLQNISMKDLKKILKFTKSSAGKIEARNLNIKCIR